MQQLRRTTKILEKRARYQPTIGRERAKKCRQTRYYCPASYVTSRRDRYRPTRRPQYKFIGFTWVQHYSKPMTDFLKNWLSGFMEPAPITE